MAVMNSEVSGAGARRFGGCQHFMSQYTEGKNKEQLRAAGIPLADRRLFSLRRAPGTGTDNGCASEKQRQTPVTLIHDDGDRDISSTAPRPVMVQCG
jgi:hypothetical protein